MTVTHSAWFVSNGQVVRRDAGPAPGAEVWSRPSGFLERFPVFTQTGVTGQIGGTWMRGGFQSGPDEFVLITEGGYWRLDMASGTVIEGPAALGATWVSTRAAPRLADMVVGLGDPSRVLFVFSDGWAIFDPVRDTFDGPHPHEELQFTRPGGDSISLTLGRTAVQMADGLLYVFGGSGYQSYDVAGRTTDGVQHPLPDAFPPLADFGLDPLFAWAMVTDADAWSAAGPSSDVPGGVLRAILGAAQQVDLSPDVLLAVINAESGVRATAYHPAGRYGLLQLTAEELASAGWTSTPAAFLDASPQQLEDVLRSYLVNHGLTGEADEAGLWVRRLVPDLDLATFSPEAVLAAPGGPRPELYASHGVADVDGDGQLTAADMNRYIRAARREPRMEALRERLRLLR